MMKIIPRIIELSLSESFELFISMKSFNTKRTYRSVIDAFESFCGPLSEVTPEKALSYFSHINKKLSDNSVLLHYQALNSIYSYFLDLDLIQKNPLRAVGRAISWRQAAQVRPTALWPFALVRKLLRLPSDNKSGVRDRAILSLLFGAGLRRSEALALNLDNVRVSPTGVLYLELPQTKAGKRQVRVLARFAWKYVSKYVSQRKQEGATNDSPLCVFYYTTGKPGHRMGAKSLWRMFRSYAAMLGIKAAPHSARATFATRIHGLTKSDLITARALGHANTEQVKVYVRQSQELENNAVVKMKY